MYRLMGDNFLDTCGRGAFLGLFAALVRAALLAVFCLFWMLFIVFGTRGSPGAEVAAVGAVDCGAA